jgi:DNA-binding CsgD family transcriptional regulator
MERMVAPQTVDAKIEMLTRQLEIKQAIIEELRSTIVAMSQANAVVDDGEKDGGRARLAAWIAKLRLTERQVAVVLFATQGQSSNEFARALQLTVSGGRVHWVRLQAKLGVHGKGELIAAVRQALDGVTPDAWESATGIPWEWPIKWKDMDEVTARIIAAT